MSRPIPSTQGRYIPGVGTTITRANIEDVQERRASRKDHKGNADPLPPATPAEIVELFCIKNGDEFGESRHLRRAIRIMAKM